MKKILVLTLFVVLSFGTVACSKKTSEEPDHTSHTDSAFMHVHGLGYSPDGKRLLIPVHNGLSVYADGKWSDGPGDKHDYMGFAAADNGFYSSGHPAPGSTYKNPLGLIKSTNEGKSITVLALEGEVDLHGMAVGYQTHTLYVLNPQPNSKMKRSGLYYSQDEGQTWTNSPMAGLQGQITAIAAHPTEKSVVVVGTTEGAYFSKDNGQTFTAFQIQHPVSAITVLNSGDILVATSGRDAKLFKVNAVTKQMAMIITPSQGGIAFIAQNPVSPEELAIVTEKKDVYITKDSGAAWHRVASKGVRK
ncbi:F510_1955 family glycosylhydrolase [Paenibacillus beijingensis]|uniref:F510_1955 family glycosylhydrolase n=1 Tax=Paenibacillus beijingensis TaxID=1126833 RepID=UPI000A70F861|nr:sialidase family protein [Paenibacillus beijingensis]